MRISDWSSDVCSSDLLGQGRLDLLAQRVIDLRSAAGGDLHGGILRIDVGQRVQRAQQHHDQDDDVFPARDFKHRDVSRASRGTAGEARRADERRAGKEGVSTVRSRWRPYTKKKKNKHTK